MSVFILDFYKKFSAELNFKALVCCLSQYLCVKQKQWTVHSLHNTCSQFNEPTSVPRLCVFMYWSWKGLQSSCQVFISYLTRQKIPVAFFCLPPSGCVCVFVVNVSSPDATGDVWTPLNSDSFTLLKIKLCPNNKLSF